MKLTALLSGCLLCLGSSAFAANQHAHPQAEKTAAKGVTWAGDCEIEIINQSYADVHVTGVFDDGYDLSPFNIYSFESPHYISLFYNGYCHSGMDLDIDTFRGYHVFGGYVRRGTSVVILPDRMNQVKANIRN